MALDRHGCTAVLRAAYTDASGTFVLTAGVAVMRSAAAAGRAMTALPGVQLVRRRRLAHRDRALIESAHPHLPPSLVARAIAGSARDRPVGGYGLSARFGLLDPAGALAEARKLASLREAAGPGPSVPMSASFAGGAAPGAIQAVHHSAWKLAGCALLMLAGLIVLLRARRLAKRWRRQARLPTAQSHRIAHD